MQMCKDAEYLPLLAGCSEVPLCLRVHSKQVRLWCRVLDTVVDICCQMQPDDTVDEYPCLPSWSSYSAAKAGPIWNSYARLGRDGCV